MTSIPSKSSTFSVSRDISEQTTSQAQAGHSRASESEAQESDEPPPKRRRLLVHPGILRDRPDAQSHHNHHQQQQSRQSSTMASIVEDPMPTITLTPIEETLKTLLLDVASYISTPGSGYSPEPHGTSEGLVLRFTGGWVRDKLLGVPSMDIDVGISSMTGYQFGMALKEYLDKPANLEKYKSQVTNEKDEIISLHKINANPEKSKHLETVTTKVFGLEVDFVNLRKETYSEDSRNPQMEFGTPYEDAMRRDATVNALFYNLNTSSVEDFTGSGLRDMRNKLIRTPLEPFQTFKDDPLRVLRLIRFSSRLGYEIDPETAAAMGHEEIKEALRRKISVERVEAEVRKTLQGPDPLKALRFIDKQNMYNMLFINHKDAIQAETTTPTFSWSSVYESLQELLDESSGAGSDLKTRQHVRNTLIRKDEKFHDTDLYHAWVLAAFSPWSIIPLRDNKGNIVAPTAKIPPRARAVAHDAMKFKNETLKVIGDAATAWEGIQAVVRKVVDEGMEKNTPPGDFREYLGLYMMDLGANWRMSVLLAMLLECCTRDRTQVFTSYSTFFHTLDSLKLIDIHTIEPIVDGHELATALGVPNGPWTKKAKDAVVQWQLRNQGVTETEENKQRAIEEVRRKREEIGWDAPVGEKGKGKRGKKGKQ